MTAMISVPTYDGKMHLGTVNGILRASKSPEHAVQFVASSLLAKCFNQLWCRALNDRKKGITHFAMLHADIAPEDYWLDTMLRIMEARNADVLSVVSPLKNSDGLTSTAIEGANTKAKRFTLKEIHAMEDKTFTHEKLLINTGLMLVDLRNPWVEQVLFTMKDYILKRGEEFFTETISEDWCFSKQARQLGAKLFATSEVSLRHFGSAAYSNDCPWGNLETDV